MTTRDIIKPSRKGQSQQGLGADRIFATFVLVAPPTSPKICVYSVYNIIQVSIVRTSIGHEIEKANISRDTTTELCFLVVTCSLQGRRQGKLDKPQSTIHYPSRVTRHATCRVPHDGLEHDMLRASKQKLSTLKIPTPDSPIWLQAPKQPRYVYLIKTRRMNAGDAKHLMPWHDIPQKHTAHSASHVPVRDGRQACSQRGAA